MITVGATLPTYLTVAPDGSVGATFTDIVVHTATIIDALIQQLQLYAGTSSNPPAANQIQWIRQSDGSVVADISAAEYVIGGSLGQVLQVAVGGASATILGNNGESSFLQIGGIGGLSETTTGTLTWGGGTGLSTASTFSLPGASGQVYGVATPFGFVSGTLEIPRLSVVPAGGGFVTVTGETSVSPGAGAHVGFTLFMVGS